MCHRALHDLAWHFLPTSPIPCPHSLDFSHMDLLPIPQAILSQGFLPAPQFRSEFLPKHLSTAVHMSLYLRGPTWLLVTKWLTTITEISSHTCSISQTKAHQYLISNILYTFFMLVLYIPLHQSSSFMYFCFLLCLCQIKTVWYNLMFSIYCVGWMYASLSDFSAMEELTEESTLDHGLTCCWLERKWNRTLTTKRNIMGTRSNIIFFFPMGFIYQLYHHVPSRLGHCLGFDSW